MTFDSNHVYKELTGEQPLENNAKSKQIRGCILLTALLVFIILLSVSVLTISLALSENVFYEVSPVVSVDIGVNKQRNGLLQSEAIPRSAFWGSDSRTLGAALTPTNLGVAVSYHRISPSDATLSGLDMISGEKLEGEVGVAFKRDSSFASILMYQDSDAETNHGILVTIGCEVVTFSVTSSGVYHAHVSALPIDGHCIHISMDSSRHVIIDTHSALYYYEPYSKEVVWAKENARGPMLVADKVLGITHPHSVFALSKKDGKVLWETKVYAKSASFITQGSVSPSEDKYYFATSVCEDSDSCSPLLYCVDIESGSIDWAMKLAQSRGGNENLHHPVVIVNPKNFPSEDHVIAISCNGFFYEFSQDGKKIWQTPTESSIVAVSSTGSIIMSDGAIFGLTGTHTGKLSSDMASHSSFIDANDNMYGVYEDHAFGNYIR